MSIRRMLDGRTVAALCAALLATSIEAQEGLKDVPPSKEWNFDAATLALIRRQETLAKAASEIRWEIEKDWDADAGGSGGFASVQLADDGVILRWKGALPESLQQAIGRARQIAPVVVEPAPYSRRELKAAARRLGQIVEAESKTGHPYLGVWVVDDRTLRVEVARGVDMAVARANLPSVGMPVEVVEGEPIKLTSRLNDSAPWWGGARFHAVRSGLVRSECTLGFGVTDWVREYMLTAAHCASYPDGARDPQWEFIGAAGRENWRHDVILIENTDAGSRIYDGGVGTGEFSKGVAGWDWVFPNEFLCTSGARSGVICRFYAANLWTERSYGCDSDGDCFWIEDLVAADQWDGRWAALDGDSGGPVFSPRSDGRVTAKGTITGIRATQTNRLLFQDFGTAWRDLGITPVVSP